jgi:hypothetical protein
MAKQPKRQPPAIIAEEFSPFGDVSDADVDSLNVRDPWWVEGYSDKRKAQDIAVSHRQRPDAVPFRLQYVRTTLMSGQPDNSKIAEFVAKGYKVVQYNDAAQYGIDVKKSGFNQAPDGSCRVANQVLMVAPAKVAAIHARAQRERTRELSEGSMSRMDQAMADYNSRNPDAPSEVLTREETLHKG